MITSAKEKAEYDGNPIKFPIESNRMWYKSLLSEKSQDEYVVFLNNGLAFYTSDGGDTFKKLLITSDTHAILMNILTVKKRMSYSHIVKYDTTPLYKPKDNFSNKIIAVKNATSDITVENAPQWTIDKFIKWAYDNLQEGRPIKSKEEETLVVSFKYLWIYSYRDAIKEIAALCDIPSLLLAGVAWIEIGGDPMFLDSMAYVARKYHINKKNKKLTSFGYVSIQARRAAEVLREDFDSLNEDEQNQLIELCTDPLSNLYMAAQHLADLKTMQFPEKSCEELTDDDIIILATRYNDGSDYSLDYILTRDYVKYMMAHKDNLQWFLGAE